MPDLVEISHPRQAGDAVAKTTREAFEKVWKGKGFVIVGAVVESPDQVPDTAELRGQALEDALTAAGLPSTGTADEKRAALAAHFGQGAQS